MKMKRRVLPTLLLSMFAGAMAPSGEVPSQQQG